MTQLESRVRDIEISVAKLEVQINWLIKINSGILLILITQIILNIFNII